VLNLNAFSEVMEAVISEAFEVEKVGAQLL
jgi:hypothetical protein